MQTSVAVVPLLGGCESSSRPPPQAAEECRSTLLPGLKNRYSRSPPTEREKKGVGGGGGACSKGLSTC